MAVIRRTGVYSWEVKRLGMIPGGGPPIGFSPTGPITGAQAAPGSTVGSSAAGVLSALQAATVQAINDIQSHGPAYTDAYLYVAGTDRARGITDLSYVQSMLGRLTVNSDGTVPNQNLIADYIDQLWPLARYSLARYFTYRNAVAGSDYSMSPTGVDLLVRDIRSGVDIAQGYTPNRAALLSAGKATAQTFTALPISPIPSQPNPFTFQPNGPASNTGSISSPIPSSAPSGSAVLPPTTGPTQIVPSTTSPLPAITGTVPGRTDIPVTPLSPTSQVTGPSWDTNMPWLKPALAVAISAAIGVGLGRLIAR